MYDMDKSVQQILHRLKPIWQTILFFYQRLRGYHSISSWFDMASGTTYYFLQGFIPFLVFLVNVMLFVMAAQIDTLYDMINAYMPDRMAAPLIADIKKLVLARSSLWMWVTGFVSLYSFVQGLEILTRATDSLDYAHTEDLARDIRHTLLIHVKGVIFTFGLMIVIILSLGLPVFGNTAVHYLDDNFGLPMAFIMLWDILRFIVPFAVLVVWLTCFYIFAPHTYTPPFRQAALTALVVTCFWLAVTAIYGRCMSVTPNMGLAYGSLFGLFALFLWFKFIASAIIYGIEFLMTLNEMELRRKIERLRENDS